ncbi:MAG: sensor histidine kinase [bacterium]
MRSLYIRLILVFLGVSLAGTLLAAFLIGQRNERAFDRFLREQGQALFVRDVRAYYAATGSLDGIERLIFARYARRGAPREAPFALADERGRIVVPGGEWRRGAVATQEALEEGLPVVVNRRRVGTVFLLNVELEREAFEQRFLSGIDRALFLGALGATAIAVVLGAVLARTLTRPLREVAEASRAVAQGDLGRQVPVRSEDELGELATAFNQMSTQVARITQQRRQMTADIAHDLRTPLTVLAGYLEAMEEGTLAPTPQRLSMMQQEVDGLTRLVEDLRILSLADADRLELELRETDVSELLARVREAHAPQAEQQQVALRVEVAPELPAVRLDPARMRQVLGNLVSNALRHTPAGGVVVLSAARENGAGQSASTVLIEVRDTGSGIAAEDLPHVFDRFYRGDRARAEGKGQSGLGLAIASSLVKMHGGTMAVDSTPGEGTTFSIRLPL